MEAGIGRLAGYGIYSENFVTVAAHMPSHYRQTNNAAELMAALRALQLFQQGEIAICSDSQYVVAGATGAARRWQLRGWQGSSGPVSNATLWALLLNELNRPGRTVHWVKVPSHVTVEGNNEADRLAEQGRMTHPKFPKPHTPARPLLSLCTPRAPKRKRLSQCTTSLAMPTRLEFSPTPPLPFHSDEATAFLRTMQLFALPESELEANDSRASSPPPGSSQDSRDTDSSSGTATWDQSQISSCGSDGGQSCSTDGSRN